MISFYWTQQKKQPPYKGNCYNHGEWENWISDICVYEDYYIQKEKEKQKPKQDKMLMLYGEIHQPYQLAFI